MQNSLKKVFGFEFLSHVSEEAAKLMTSGAKLRRLVIVSPYISIKRAPSARFLTDFATSVGKDKAVFYTTDKLNNHNDILWLRDYFDVRVKRHVEGHLPHAKIVYIEFDNCIVIADGSANLTMPALAKTGNLENMTIETVPSANSEVFKERQEYIENIIQMLSDYEDSTMTITPQPNVSPELVEWVKTIEQDTREYLKKLENSETSKGMVVYSPMQSGKTDRILGALVYYFTKDKTLLLENEKFIKYRENLEDYIRIATTLAFSKGENLTPSQIKILIPTSERNLYQQWKDRIAENNKTYGGVLEGLVPLRTGGAAGDSISARNLADAVVCIWDEAHYAQRDHNTVPRALDHIKKTQNRDIFLIAVSATPFAKMLQLDHTYICKISKNYKMTNVSEFAVITNVEESDKDNSQNVDLPVLDKRNQAYFDCFLGLEKDTEGLDLWDKQLQVFKSMKTETKDFMRSMQDFFHGFLGSEKPTVEQMNKWLDSNDELINPFCIYNVIRVQKGKEKDKEALRKYCDQLKAKQSFGGRIEPQFYTGDSGLISSQDLPFGLLTLSQQIDLLKRFISDTDRSQITSAEIESLKEYFHITGSKVVKVIAIKDLLRMGNTISVKQVATMTDRNGDFSNVASIVQSLFGRGCHYKGDKDRASLSDTYPQVFLGDTVRSKALSFRDMVSGLVCEVNCRSEGREHQRFLASSETRSVAQYYECGWFLDTGANIPKKKETVLLPIFKLVAAPSSILNIVDPDKQAGELQKYVHSIFKNPEATQAEIWYSLDTFKEYKMSFAEIEEMRKNSPKEASYRVTAFDKDTPNRPTALDHLAQEIANGIVRREGNSIMYCLFASFAFEPQTSLEIMKKIKAFASEDNSLVVKGGLYHAANNPLLKNQLPKETESGFLLLRFALETEDKTIKDLQVV